MVLRKLTGVAQRAVSPKTGATQRKKGKRTRVSFPREGGDHGMYVVPTYEASARGKTASARGKREKYYHGRRGVRRYAK